LKQQLDEAVGKAQAEVDKPDPGVYHDRAECELLGKITDVLNRPEERCAAKVQQGIENSRRRSARRH
jgi:hypothetical protein